MVSDPNLVPRSPTVIRREIWQSSISSMLSDGEARNTGLSITAHVRTFHFDFAERNMDFESILEEIILGREQGNLKLKPKQKVALQVIGLNGQDCPSNWLRQIIDLPNASVTLRQDKLKCYIRGQVNFYCCFSFKCLT